MTYIYNLYNLFDLTNHQINTETLLIDHTCRKMPKDGVE